MPVLFLFGVVFVLGMRGGMSCVSSHALNM